MARDLAEHHIRVISIAPGPFVTPMTGMIPRKAYEATLRLGLLYPPRFGFPREFAETVKWILECAYINAETVYLTGGQLVPNKL